MFLLGNLGDPRTSWPINRCACILRTYDANSIAKSSLKTTSHVDIAAVALPIRKAVIVVASMRSIRQPDNAGEAFSLDPFSVFGNQWQISDRFTARNRGATVERHHTPRQHATRNN